MGDGAGTATLTPRGGGAGVNASGTSGRTAQTGGVLPERCYAVVVQEAPSPEQEAPSPEPRSADAPADRSAKASTQPETLANGGARAVVRSVVGVGIGIATLMVMLAGLQLQQNANVNTRIDDLNARFDDLSANVNARFDDLNARFDDLEEDIRELRALIIDALHRPDPAD